MCYIINLLTSHAQAALSTLHALLSPVYLTHSSFPFFPSAFHLENPYRHKDKVTNVSDDTTLRFT